MSSSSIWSWDENGDPSFPIRPGFEVSVPRTSDLEMIIAINTAYRDLTPAELEAEEIKFRPRLQKRIDETRPHLADWRSGKVPKEIQSFVIRDTSNGRPAGSVMFNDVQEGDEPNTRNMGWSTMPDYRRKGLATDAVKAVIKEFSAKVQKLDSVNGFCREDNLGSVGVMRSVGFEKVAEFDASDEKFKERPQLRGDGKVFFWVKDLRQWREEDTSNSG